MEPVSKPVPDADGSKAYTVDIQRGGGDNFSAARVDQVVADIVRAMPSYGVQEYFDYKRSMFSTSDYVGVGSDPAGRAVGLLVTRRYELPKASWFLNLETLLIGENYQRSALSRYLLGAMFARVAGDLGFPDLVTMKTYTPRSYKIMYLFAQASVGIRVYPDVNASAQDEDLQAVAASIAAVLAPDLDFDKRSGVIYGAAGEVPDDFWPSFPDSRNQTINNYFVRYVSTRDRLLCVAHVPSAAAKQRVLQILAAETAARE